MVTLPSSHRQTLRRCLAASRRDPRPTQCVNKPRRWQDEQRRMATSQLAKQRPSLCSAKIRDLELHARVRHGSLASPQHLCGYLVLQYYARRLALQHVPTLPPSPNWPHCTSRSPGPAITKLYQGITQCILVGLVLLAMSCCLLCQTFAHCLTVLCGIISQHAKTARFLATPSLAYLDLLDARLQAWRTHRLFRIFIVSPFCLTLSSLRP